MAKMERNSERSDVLVRRKRRSVISVRMVRKERTSLVRNKGLKLGKTKSYFCRVW